MIYIKQSKAVIVLFIIGMLVISMSCKTVTPSDLSKESIIPRPVSIAASGDYFELEHRFSRH